MVKTVINPPFGIIRDSREQLPYWFKEMPVYDPVSGNVLPDVVMDGTPMRGSIPVGDYAWNHMVGKIVVERKSVTDLFNTLSNAKRRERFKRQLKKMNAMPRAAVVVEGLQTTILEGTNWNPLPGDACLRIAGDLQKAYDRVFWLYCDGRVKAELAAWKFLVTSEYQLRDDEMTEYWRAAYGNVVC